MSILNRLLSRKTAVEQSIAVKRWSVTRATEALSYCDRLERELPTRIAETRAELDQQLSFSKDDTYPDDDHPGRSELQVRMERVAALEGLLKDLPDIKRHWQAVLSNIK